MKQVAAGLMLALFLGGMAQAADVSFKIKNDTGGDITAVQAGPSGGKQWVALAASIANGKDASVKLAAKAGVKYEIHAKDASGKALVWKGVSMQDPTEVDLHADGIVGVTSGLHDQGPQTK